MLELGVLWSAFIIADQSASGHAEEYARRTRHSMLANGMAVVTHRVPWWDHVRIDMWVRVGSAHEGAYSGAGINHFVEHALFNGSHPLLVDGVEVRRGFGYEEIAQEIHALGGYERAESAEDYTVITFELDSADAVRGIELMEPLVLRAEIRDDQHVGPGTEMDVVLDEVRSVLRSSQRCRYYMQNSLMWGPRGYGAQGIGTIAGVTNLSGEDLRRFYNAHYVPNAMTLVIVGPVEHGEIAEAAEETFVGPDVERPLHPAGAASPVSPVASVLPPLGIERIEPRTADGGALLDLSHRVVVSTAQDRALALITEHLLQGEYRDLPSGLQCRVFSDLHEYGGALTVRVRTGNLKSAKALGHSAVERAKTMNKWVTWELFDSARGEVERALLRTWETGWGISKNLGATTRPGCGVEEFDALLSCLRNLEPGDVAVFARRLFDATNRVVVGEAPCIDTGAVETRQADEHISLENGTTLVMSDSIGLRDALAIAFPVAANERVSHGRWLIDQLNAQTDDAHVSMWPDDNVVAFVCESRNGAIPLLSSLDRMFALIGESTAVENARPRHDWTPRADQAVLEAIGAAAAKCVVVELPDLFERVCSVAVCSDRIRDDPRDLVSWIEKRNWVGGVADSTPSFGSPPSGARLTLPGHDCTARIAVYFLAPMRGSLQRRSFDALTYTLDNRVQEAVRRRGLARFVGGLFRRDPDAFVLSATTFDPKRINAIEHEFLKILREMAKHGLNGKEIMAHEARRHLDRARRASTRAGYVAGLASGVLRHEDERLVGESDVLDCAREWLAHDAGIWVRMVSAAQDGP